MAIVYSKLDRKELFRYVFRSSESVIYCALAQISLWILGIFVFFIVCSSAARGQQGEKSPKSWKRWCWKKALICGEFPREG